MRAPTIPSPCQNKCCLDTFDICLGCLRSLQEITEWAQADIPRKQQILHNVQARARLRAAWQDPD